MEASNVKAMREALLNIQEYAAAMDVDDGNVLAILDACRDALSAPPRNCDVGTAEEQTHRMLLYCKSHGVDESRCFRCKGCPLLTADICELSWAQMPYEAQEGGAK